jgi:hypothetical protein
MEAIHKAFPRMHNTAIANAENPVNGNVRMNYLEDARYGDKTYTKYLGEKGGITIEKTPNNTTNMVPQKNFIPLKIDRGLKK